MKRRGFVKVLGAGSVGVATLGTEQAHARERGTTRKRVLMKVGCQAEGIADDNPQFKARHGVFHFDPGSPRWIEGVGWDLDDAQRQVEACAKYGIKLEAFHLSHANDHFRQWRNIMLGRSPERDREGVSRQRRHELLGRDEGAPGGRL